MLLCALLRLNTFHETLLKRYDWGVGNTGRGWQPTLYGALIHNTRRKTCVEITGITGVSLSKAINAMPVIPVIGIPLSEDDRKVTESPAE
jgi:hypothetical protein